MSRNFSKSVDVVIKTAPLESPLAFKGCVNATELSQIKAKKKGHTLER